VVRIRNSEFGFSTHPPVLVLRAPSEKGPSTGGAWLPHCRCPHRQCGVPGILSGSALGEEHVEHESYRPKNGHGDGYGYGRSTIPPI